MQLLVINVPTPFGRHIETRSREISRQLRVSDLCLLYLCSERLADFSIFNMADYTLILEDLLKKASTKSGEEFKYLCTEVNEKIGVFTWKVPEYSNFTVDFNS